MLLKFDHEQGQVLLVTGMNTQSDYCATVTWREEQVKDFVHRLGFFECDDEQKQKQDTFMAATDVSS